MSGSLTIRDIAFRTILYLVLLSILIGACGYWVVQNQLFSAGDFWIYGNKGKLIILLAILFPFLIRNKLHLLPHVTWKKSHIVFGIGTIGTLIGFFITSAGLAESLPAKPLFYYLSSHILLLLTPLLLLLCIFGPKFLLTCIQTFKKELALMGAIGIGLYVAIFQVWKLWPLFSALVLRAVSTVFSLSFQTSVIPPDILVVESFRVQVGQECSGLESLFMFSVLYMIIGYIERQHLNKLRYIAAYIPLAIGLNLLNIIRVYLIVLVGVLWSPEVAVTLFHTYLGMVLFVLYFLLFIRVIYPQLKK